MHGHEIRISPHGKADLSGVRKQQHEWYLAHEEPDGTIILTPALLVPAKLALSPEAGGELVTR